MPDLSIAKGTCYLLFAYDVARAIDLDEAERHVVALKQREVLKHGRRATKYLEYRPPPLRITQDVAPMAIGDYRSGASVDLVLYDFGAVSVTYTIPLMGPFSGLLTLSNDLYEVTSLLADSRQQVEQLLAVIRSALSKPNIADLVDDYAIYHIEAFTMLHDIADLCMHYAQEIAQILRAEHQPLSEQEVKDALAHRIAVGLDDVAIVDWNATLLVDPEGDDVRTVLEFANVEWLELCYLDRSLDDTLDRSYEALTKPQRNARLGPVRCRSTPCRPHASGQCHPVRRSEQRSETPRRSISLAGLSFSIATLSLGGVGRQHPAQTADAREHL